MFQLTEEYLEIQENIHRIAQEKVKPRAVEIDEVGEYPHDMKELFARYGYLGANIPEEYGGAGLDMLSFCLIVEEVARVAPLLPRS